MKVVRIGVTESALMLLQAFGDEAVRASAFASNKLWYGWNTNGFYDTAFDLQTNDRADVRWETHWTRVIERYFDDYLRACDGADVVIHLRRSIIDANENFAGGEALLTRLLSSLPNPPARTEDRFRYAWVNERAVGRRVHVVSPFAPLIAAQHASGRLAALRPDFRPASLEPFAFPYCFANQGPHRDSFETIAWAADALAARVRPGDVVTLSCGSMGALLTAQLQARGADVFYCGGAMQLFFGIMGNRWRGARVDMALHPDDRLLDSWRTDRDLWIEAPPPELVPQGAQAIEGACYW